MTIVLCDACGTKMSGRGNKFEYLCHLEDLQGWHGYAEYDTVESAASNCVDLCNKCYNDIVSKAVIRFMEVSKKRKVYEHE